MDILEKMQRRADLIRECREITEKAQKENRTALTAAEDHAFTKKMAEADSLALQIKSEDARSKEEANSRAADFDSLGGGYRSFADGEIRMFSPKQRMAETRGRNGMNLGAFLSGVVTGRWEGSEERDYAPMGSAGSYVIPAPLSLELIDLARAQMQVIAAGATTVQMDSATLSFAKVLTDPTAAWRNENSAITPSNPTLGPVTLTARSLAALTTVSEELLSDSPLAQTMLVNCLAQALALELDRACLFGNGTAPIISGIYDQIGVGAVQEVAATGADGDTVTQQKFSLAVQAILAAHGNAEALSAIYAPRLAGELDRLLDGNGNPASARPLASFAKLRHLVSGNVPIDQTQGESSDATTAIVGDYSKLILGMRENVQIYVDRGGDDFGTHSVSLKAVLRADCALSQPSHFCCITGLIAPSA